MNIGIDARLINETGVGRYIRNLIQELSVIDTQNEYVLYTLKNSRFPLQLTNSNVRIKKVDVYWHTLKEQIQLPNIYSQDKLDVLHVPYFTVPLLYKGPLVLTLHDLTILRVNTGKASTLPYPLYMAKRLGYQYVVREGIKKARHIFAVSETTKRDLLHTYPVSPSKVSVTYEGVDPHFLLPVSEKKKSPYHAPYVLYVGNAYPHKNIELLLDVMTCAKESNHEMLQRGVKLVFVGKSDFFYERLKLEVHKRKLNAHIDFVGNLDDEELAVYYTYAHATVSPSMAEGFALPLLESLAFNTPVIVSDIPIFRELLPSSSFFVSLHNPFEWLDRINRITAVSKQKVWKNMQEKESFFARYSWRNMAVDTLAVYKKIGTSSRSNV